MILFKLFLVGAGGFIGAMLRYAISQWINNRSSSDLPVATLLVNTLGSFLLGIVIGLDVGTLWFILCGTGVLGAFTTFSTFKLESIQLHGKKKWKVLLLYTLLSYSLGIVLAYAGFALGRWF